MPLSGAVHRARPGMAARLALALALPAAAAARRTEALFNDGWLFKAGDTPGFVCSSPASAAVFPIDVSDTLVLGLNALPGGANASAAACAAACAGNCSCQVWQYCATLLADSVCAPPAAAAAADCTFPAPFDGLQCYGLNAASAASETDCAAACCDDPSCEVWQWSDRPLPAGGCWIGQVPPTGCAPGSNWTSYANTTRAPSVPSWAALDFPADAAWAVVDAPHDFIITGANETESPFNQTAEQGQAFIPKTVGVYRKHFALPASFAGTHVELYVEGMYAFATYYINGALLGVHALGYTSYSARLDNVTGGLFYGGADNVLAIFVDASGARDTGWWYEGGGGAFPPHIYTHTPTRIHPHPHPHPPPPTPPTPFPPSRPNSDAALDHLIARARGARRARRPARGLFNHGLRVRRDAD